MPAARSPARHSDRGSASIELVILFPALLLLVTALVQYGLWFHARSVALAAAQDGVAAARTYDATPDDGRIVALAFVNDNGGDTLLDATALARTPSVGQVEVIVSGHSLSLVPGLPGPSVSQSAAGPVERFVPDGQP